WRRRQDAAARRDDRKHPRLGGFDGSDRPRHRRQRFFQSAADPTSTATTSQRAMMRNLLKGALAAVLLTGAALAQPPKPAMPSAAKPAAPAQAPAAADQ